MATIRGTRDRMLVALETSAPIRLESLTILQWKHFIEVLKGYELKEGNKELGEEDTVILKKDETGKPLIQYQYPHIGLKSVELKGKGRGRYANLEQHCWLHKFAIKWVLKWKKRYEELTGMAIDPNKLDTLELPFLIRESGEVLDENGKPIALSYSALNLAFDRHKTEEYPFTLHSWRRYVESNIRKFVAKEDRNKIMAHKPKEIEDAYDSDELEITKEQFLEAIPNINPEYDFEMEDTVERLRAVFEKEGRPITKEKAKKYIGQIVQKFIASMED